MHTVLKNMETNLVRGEESKYSLKGKKTTLSLATKCKTFIDTNMAALTTGKGCWVTQKLGLLSRDIYS